jgi:hypothetical protein
MQGVELPGRNGMPRAESNSSLLVWTGWILLAVAAAVVGGFWVYSLVVAALPLALLTAILAIPIGLAVLLVAAMRDRVMQMKSEKDLAEVEY